MLHEKAIPILHEYIQWQEEPYIRGMFLWVDYIVILCVTILYKNGDDSYIRISIIACNVQILHKRLWVKFSVL